jgi:hypothetical protein
MKKIIVTLFLSAVGLVALQLTSCDRSTEPDPCSLLEPASADFIVGESFFGTDTVINSDTIRRGRSIIFKALGRKGKEMDYETYEWKIGNDPRVFTQKVVSLLFNDANEIQPLTVTLTVKDQVLAGCFPDGGGQAVLTKQYVLVPRSTSVVFGDYEGALDENPNEKFIVSVRICQFGDICTVNINRGCNNHADPPLSGSRIRPEIAYRAMFIDSGTTFFEGCDNPKGWLYFGKSINDVIIQYTTSDPANRTGPRKRHRFTGRRIK